MSKTRSLLVLGALCVAVGIFWLTSAPSSKATPTQWPKSFGS